MILISRLSGKYYTIFSWTEKEKTAIQAAHGCSLGVAQQSIRTVVWRPGRQKLHVTDGLLNREGLSMLLEHSYHSRVSESA